MYEPYLGEYYLVGPLPTQHNPPLFQPGFDYKFVECCCDYPQPADYTDISYSINTLNVLNSATVYETDYESIIHPNHSAILIKEVEDALGFSYPRKCYDNNNRKPSGGKITRFNDNVFNANVTITSKDSLGINNPNLINNLPNGLYSIEKEFQDGNVEQTVIVKENN